MRTRRAAVLGVLVLGIGSGVVFGWPWLQALRAARGAAAAESHFQAARQAHYPGRTKAGLKPDYATAIDEYRKAVEANPRRIDAHRGLIDATRALHFARASGPNVERADELTLRAAFYAAGRDELLAFYEGFQRRHPREPAAEWALGQLSATGGARAHYLKAVELDPHFATGYAELARLAQRVDDRPRMRELWRKAAEADPTSAEYAYSAAVVIDADDQRGFRQAMDHILTRFRDSHYAAFVLGEAARRATTMEDRIALLERQHREYPDPGRALSLFRAYLPVDPNKAMALARSVGEQATQTWVGPMWKPYIACGDALIEARQLVAAGRFAEARVRLDRATAQWPCSMAPLHLARARIELADGGAARALDYLMSAAATARSTELQAALVEFGARAGWTPVAVENGIWRRRTRAARSMEDFTLPRLDGSGAVRLADLRGQVVLVNFWYPG